MKGGKATETVTWPSRWWDKKSAWREVELVRTARAGTRINKALLAPRGASSDKHLCAACNSINWDAIFDDKPDKEIVRKTLLVARFDTYNDLEQSCSMCKLLAIGTDPDQKPIFLVAKRITEVVMRWRDPYSDANKRVSSKPVRETLVLELEEGPPSRNKTYEEQRTIFAASRENLSPSIWQGLQVSRSQVDFSRIGSWMQFCGQHHEACLSTRRKEGSPLRLVDCRSKEIVRNTDNFGYAALSYVWGTPDPLIKDWQSFTGVAPVPLPANLPAVIQDAMTLVAATECQYIWIDQLCINQSDKHEKWKEIEKMSDIYGSAWFTIIAAAGQGSTYGLPGIGSRPRAEYPAVAVGRQKIFAITDPMHEIVKTTWSTRGWTYQEAILSKRRLYLTDTEVYFECVEMFSQESMSIPLSEFDKRRQGPVTKVYPHGRDLFDDDDSLEYATDAMEVFSNCVNAYNNRQLSVESDRFIAFSALLKLLEGKKVPLKHFWGLPLPMPCKKSSFSRMLLWSSTDQSSRDSHEDEAYRRPDFPSWTWFGWTGQVHFAEGTGSDQDVYGHEIADVAVWASRKDESLLQLQSHNDAVALAEDMMNLSSRLRVSAKIFKIGVSQKHSPEAPMWDDEFGHSLGESAEEQITEAVKQLVWAQYTSWVRSRFNAQLGKATVNFSFSSDKAELAGTLDALAASSCSLLLLSHVMAVDKYSEWDHFLALLLVRPGKEPGVWHRAGVVWIEGRSQNHQRLPRKFYKIDEAEIDEKIWADRDESDSEESESWSNMSSEKASSDGSEVSSDSSDGDSDESSSEDSTSDGDTSSDSDSGSAGSDTGSKKTASKRHQSGRRESVSDRLLATRWYRKSEGDDIWNDEGSLESIWLE